MTNRERLERARRDLERIAGGNVDVTPADDLRAAAALIARAERFALDELERDRARENRTRRAAK